MGPEEEKNKKKAASEAVAGVAAGGPDAVSHFETIIETYGPRVFSLAKRMFRRSDEAEEAAQEVFIRVWRKMRLYDPAKGRFESWLTRLASNALLNLATKKQKAVDFSSLAGADGHGIENTAESDAPDVADAAANAEVEERVKSEILRLPAEYRLVVSLRYLEDACYEDIATATGLPMGTVKNRLYRAREILKERLKEHL